MGECVASLSRAHTQRRIRQPNPARAPLRLPIALLEQAGLSRWLGTGALALTCVELMALHRLQRTR